MKKLERLKLSKFKKSRLHHKKLSISLMFAVLIAIIGSCQKSNVKPNHIKSDYDFRKDESFSETFISNERVLENDNTKRLNLDKIMEVAKMENKEVKITAYNLLNSSERILFWETLITKKLENNYFSAN